MKEKLLRSLIFLKLVDPHDNNLSLTSIAVLVALVKLSMTNSASMSDLGALFTVLLSYTSKKFINNQQQ